MMLPALSSCEADSIEINEDMKCYMGSGEPTRNDINNGDVYLDKEALDVYRYSENAWIRIGNLTSGINPGDINDGNKQEKVIASISGENVLGEDGFHYVQLHITYTDGTSDDQLIRNKGLDDMVYSVLDSCNYVLPLQSTEQPYNIYKIPFKCDFSDGRQLLIYCDIFEGADHLEDRGNLNFQEAGTYNLKYKFDEQEISVPVTVKDLSSSLITESLIKDCFPIYSGKEEFVYKHIVYSSNTNIDGVYYSLMNEDTFNQNILPYTNSVNEFIYADKKISIYDPQTNNVKSILLIEKDEIESNIKELQVSDEFTI